MINDEIRRLLESPRAGKNAPSIDDIEDMLTTGYASALALDAERRRLERRIAEAAANLRERPGERQHSELVQLGQRLSEASGDLSHLRELLSSLRTRAEATRTAP
jgi:hypothetical protein